MINVLSFRVLIFHDHVIINDTMIKYFPRKAKNTLDLSSSMLAVRSPTIRQNKGKTDHASFAIHTFGRYVSGKDSLINMFCPCLCNKNQQKKQCSPKELQNLFPHSQSFFSLTRVPQIVCCSRHLLWDPISREISDHTSPSTSLPWSKENRKLTTPFIPLYCPPSPLYINLNFAGPHISLLCPVFCFFCALIWKSNGWAWIIRSFWRTWEHLCCSEATSVCSLLLQLSPELSTIQLHRSKLILNDIVGAQTLTCILLVVFTHLALLLLGRATPGFHALFSTFRTKNTITHKVFSVLTLFQELDAVGAVMDGIGCKGRFHEKKVAILLDFVQRGGEGPAQIVVTFS